MFVCGSQARRPQQQQRSYHEQQPRQTQAAAAAPEYGDAAIVVSFVYAGLKQPTRVSPVRTSVASRIDMVWGKVTWGGGEKHCTSHLISSQNTRHAHAHMRTARVREGPLEHHIQCQMRCLYGCVFVVCCRATPSTQPWCRPGLRNGGYAGSLCGPR